MFSSVHSADFVVIGILVVLEGLLSADNALVMAVMVVGLPEREHRKALNYGLVGAFVFRTVATALAVYLIHLIWVKLAGGLYLLYLVVAHFRERPEEDGAHARPPAKRWFGLSRFWSTVVRVEVMNLAFSIDSILVAVAMSSKFWVVLSGGLLGIVAMRVVVGWVIRLIQRYPALVHGAFIIIGWVAVKLILDWAYEQRWVSWEVPQALSLALIAVALVGSYLYARAKTV